MCLFFMNLYCIFFWLQVFASEPERSGRGEQRLSVAVLAAGVVQQERGARQVQILHPERQARGNESHG